MTINKEVKFILNKLNKAGFEAFLVGGCVRDFIMNKIPHDYDICTNATPDKIKKIFSNCKVLSHGEKHGTITVVLSKSCYEITTYRIDGQYKDSRRPETVNFTSSLEKDLERRDFTINAIAYNNGFIDPFNGRKDIKNKIIKCVGNPEHRFNEDALRILRALRFASVLGFTIEKNTKNAIFKLYKNLDNISMERINSEFSKLLLGKNCINILSEYKEVFFHIIPELKVMDGFNQNNSYHLYDVFTHTLHVIENAPDNLVLRLTALFHDIGKPYTYVLGEDGQGHFYNHPIKSAEITNIILSRLKYSNEIKNNVITLIEEHSIDFAVSKKFVRRMLNKLGEEKAKQLLIFRKADIIGQKGKEVAIERLEKVDKIYNLLEEVLKEENCFKITDLKINGKDLLNKGIKQGKEIGYYLNTIFNKVLDGELNNDKSELLSFVDNLIGESNGKI